MYDSSNNGEERAMEQLLIVDDEPGIRMLLKDYFEMTGYETWTAEMDGRQSNWQRSSRI